MNPDGSDLGSIGIRVEISDLTGCASNCAPGLSASGLDGTLVAVLVVLCCTAVVGGVLLFLRGRTGAS